MADVKDIIDEEEEDGKDAINLMVCKNCTKLKQKDDKWFCEEHQKETKLDGTCSLWDEADRKSELKEVYMTIREVISYYIDTSEENRSLMALWIMGTYFHEMFATYPYLYLTAMKGSGKTRVLKLIKALAWEGDLLAALTDAVLFRSVGTLCIDEFENLGGKEKNSLRELLNTAYKKGGKVKRMRKSKGIEGESQVIEAFSTFRPVVMANIWGMEEVLGDRCINIVLEKSAHQIITRLIENFDTDPKIVKLKKKLGLLKDQCSLCSVVSKKNISQKWNNYLYSKYTTTYTTITTYNNTNNIEGLKPLFTKIDETKINGRNLELTFPLFLLAHDVGILDEVITLTQKIIKDKKTEDIMESRDVMVYDLASRQDTNWYRVKELTNILRNLIEIDEEERWLNAKWLGRALKRLNLIKDKRRMSEGMEVILNVDKAKEKMLIFK